MNIVKSNIANALTSAAKDHVLGVANDIYDEIQDKYQSEINAEIIDNLSDVINKDNANSIINQLNILYKFFVRNNLSTQPDEDNTIRADTFNKLLNSYHYADIHDFINRVASFLNQTDVSNEAINKWKELEAFLQGITDTETLTGLLEQLKTELKNKIIENTTTVKDVDNKTLVVNEKGIVKINYTEALNGHIKVISSDMSPVRVNLRYLNNHLYADAETNVYDGQNNISKTSNSLIQEKALYKIVQTIPDIKIFEVTNTSDNTELFNFIQATEDNYKKVIIKKTGTSKLIVLLTIESFTDKYIYTNRYFNNSNSRFCYGVITHDNYTINYQNLISDSIESLNGEKIINGSISGSKFTQDIQQRFAELQQVIIKTNTNSTNITDIITLLNNFGITDTFDVINNDYNKLLNIIGVIADAEQLTELTTKFNELGNNYSTLYKVAKTLHDFLENNDVADTTINRWKEIESFLAGITDDKTLLGIVNDSITTNNENYYDKTYIDNKVATIPNIKFFTVTNNSNNTELFNYLFENEENYKNIYINYIYNNNNYVFNINNYNINNTLNNYIITNNVIPQPDDESFSIHLYITPSTTTINKHKIYYNQIASVDGTVIISETIQTSSLTKVLQNKINNIPNLKIFTLGNDNTELINYITNNGYKNVLIYTNNDRLLQLHGNNITETYIASDGTLIYYTFDANNVILHNRALIGQSIANKNITKEKLADSLLTELLTNSSIATDEEITEILNTI